MDKKQQTIDTYNKNAKAMTAKFNVLGGRVEDIERLFSFLNKENSFVFEIGCGNGRDAKEIVKKTNNYLGVDISEGFIKIASEYVPGGKFKIVDMESYDFPKNIDAIVSFASLLHSNKENVANILVKAHKALNDGGVFYISLKKDEYHENGSTCTDEFGERTFFFYTPELIQELAGSNYETIYINEQNIRGQEWFTIVLKKI